MKTPEQRQATDRQNAVTDAADPIAEYLHKYVQKPDYNGQETGLMADVNLAVLMRLTTMATEAAEERALDEKADLQGTRY